MIDLSKSYDFFKPEQCKGHIHIIGCGSVGSTVAELLVRFGLTNLTLYDFDTVEPHNIANQRYTQKHIGKLKTEALAEILSEINPDIQNTLRIESEGYTNQKVSGYVFLCVDSIELRKKIAIANQYSTYIEAMFDFRTRLTDAQHYAADWRSSKQIKSFIDTMNFTDKEAEEATPVSACNITLSVAPTVWTICSAGVANFINFINEKRLSNVILTDAFSFKMESF